MKILYIYLCIFASVCVIYSGYDGLYRYHKNVLLRERENILLGAEFDSLVNVKLHSLQEQIDSLKAHNTHKAH